MSKIAQNRDFGGMTRSNDGMKHANFFANTINLLGRSKILNMETVRWSIPPGSLTQNRKFSIFHSKISRDKVFGTMSRREDDMGTIIHGEKMLRIMVGMELPSLCVVRLVPSDKGLSQKSKEMQISGNAKFRFFFDFWQSAMSQESEMKSWGPRI